MTSKGLNRVHFILFLFDLIMRTEAPFPKYILLSVEICDLRIAVDIYVSLICDKSVTIQNLAFFFFSYWYRKKRLQIHF